MDSIRPQGLDPLSRPDPTQETKAASPGSGTGLDPLAFRSLLEEIERIRIQGGDSPEPGNQERGDLADPQGSERVLEDFDAALDRAEAVHERAMDLKNRLESAFRRTLGG